ncbi:MAG TPA: hypothetical protein VM841_15755 [Actinomycetota bacterium]|nr:hypothetical protein [Actinomycetota bacterium]
MKRLLALVALAAAVLGVGGSPARADSICFRSGLVILGEPWLSHQQCVPCPTVDCFAPRNS